jgi:hypothetical protein
VTIFQFAPVRSLERTFTSKRVDQIELFPHDHPPTALLDLLNVEVATLKVKMVRILTKEAKNSQIISQNLLRKDLFFILPLLEFILAPIDKEVPIP